MGKTFFFIAQGYLLLHKLKCHRFVLQSFRQSDFHLVALDFVFSPLAVGQDGHFAFGDIRAPFDGFGERFLVGQGIDGVEGLAVFVGGEPYVAVLVMWGRFGIVDGFPVCAEPFAHLVQDVDGRLLDDAFRCRTYAQEQAATFCGDFGKQADHFGR